MRDPLGFDVVFSPVLPVERHEGEGRDSHLLRHAADVAEVVAQGEVVGLRGVHVPADQGPEGDRSDHLRGVLGRKEKGQELILMVVLAFRHSACLFAVQLLLLVVFRYRWCCRPRW